MQKKVKHLDQFRPNVLPRMLSTSPEKYGSQALSEADNSLQREKLLELLSQTENGVVAERPDVMKLMGKKQAENTAFRKNREKEMFNLSAEFDTFALPGKPLQTGLLSAEQRQSKVRTTRKLKVTDITNESSMEEKDMSMDKPVEEEFAFLNESLGMSKSAKLQKLSVQTDDMDMESPINSPTNASVKVNVQSQSQKQAAGNSGSHNTSDLDQIAGIMESIVTGGDALNFFARFGSETPVKFVHLIQVEDSKIYRYALLKLLSRFSCILCMR
jgi:hypothetical protein